jgi:hypothetical protein
MLFFTNIARNMFRVYFINRAACKAILFAIKAILQKGSDNNVKRSDLVDNNSRKETLLLPEMF